MMTFVLGAVAVVLSVLWMSWTIRQAVIARRGPGDDRASHLRHFDAVGGVAWTLAVALALGLTALSDRPLLQALPAAVVAAAVIAAGERRWPVPSGQVRAVPLVARRGRDLIPVPGLIMALAGLVSAAVVIGLCWMVGNTDGTSISRNVPGPDGANSVVSVAGFPGRPVGVAALLGGACLVVMIGLAVRVTARQSALVGLDAADDLRMRRATVDRLLRLAAITAWVTTYLVMEAARTVVMSGEWPPEVAQVQWSFSWVPWVCLVAGVISRTVLRVRPAAASAVARGGSRTDQPA